MTSDQESVWIAQAQAGSTVAFGRLVDWHQQRLRAFLRRLCGNWAQADDLAQETFVAAWTQIRRFRSGHSFSAWLCGIGYRKFLAERRAIFRRGRRHRLLVSAAVEGVDSTAGVDAELDLARALQSLPADQRAVVSLCLAAGLSHGEAAEALGIPLGTVKSYIQRGRAQLLLALSGHHG